LKTWNDCPTSTKYITLARYMQARYKLDLNHMGRWSGMANPGHNPNTSPKVLAI